MLLVPILYTNLQTASMEFKQAFSNPLPPCGHRVAAAAWPCLHQVEAWSGVPRTGLPSIAVAHYTGPQTPWQPRGGEGRGGEGRGGEGRGGEGRGGEGRGGRGGGGREGEGRGGEEEGGGEGWRGEGMVNGE